MTILTLGMMLALAACTGDKDDTGGGDGGATDGGVADGGVADGGVADGGVADGGVADGGSTDGGSTDGGSTDGGSTDGGSTDGGSTDGGSTDGGSTDGGSTDGGSTDGGSTDGGSTDGGSTDGGSGDGGAELPEHLSTCHADDGDAYGYWTKKGPTITDDSLTVWVQYSGGCAEHDFVLCWPDGSFMESDPVQVGLELWHEDNDDPCDSIVSDSLTFDLAPLAEAYEAAYGSSEGTILVNIAGDQLAYDFD